MPNLVGIGLSQVPTNSMLGGMAYQDPEHASIKDLDLKNLSQINSEIANTAVDVFIYDTSKDSDGGAWRKRTQHTSWYNETLNTATRGSRKEFPAVAVIVISNNTAGLTIYDGDDPNLPMWMVFNETAGQSIWTGTDRSSVAALNGIIVVGQTTTIPLAIIGFVADEVYNRRADTTKYNISNIAIRNTSDTYSISSYFSQGLVNTVVNDVAMTVLPNAPIDDATGLPIPTIAVATNTGVSVIRDDGTVYDVIDTNSARKCYDVSFTKDHKIMHTGDLGAGSTHAGNVFVTNVLTADRSEYDNHSDLYRWYSTSQNYPRINGGNTFNTRVLDPVDVGGHHYAMADVGISLIEDGTSSSYGNTDGMVAYATTSYNTGWMHGDITGAFLSDTDDTNLSTTDLGLITNGDFSNGTTGWSNNATEILTVTGGVASVDRNGGSSSGQCYQTITTEVGRTYTVGVQVTALSHGFQVYADSGDIGMSQGAINSTGTHYWTFTATTSATRLDFSAVQNVNGTASFDNITIFDGVGDRSVNKKGLAVYGTITKSAVATGAELVAYGGFSGSNYLRQSHNADLNVGTGDFYIMCWVKGNQLMLWHRNDSGSLDMRCEFPASGGNANKPRFLMNNGGVSIDFSATTAFDTTTWHHCVWVKRGARGGELYIDGILNNSATAGSDLTLNGTNSTFSIGNRADSPTEAFNGYTSLFRFGASAPSAEQIKKIYEDEKFLFQQNAACTLYGSSDAVTALAYDDSTNLLYAGTSSGRSDFQGLRRINNTTTAVTTAISASNGLVAEQ